MANLSDHIDFEGAPELKYVNGHAVIPVQREIVMMLTLFTINGKSKIVGQFILNPVHAQELVLALQTEIKRLKDGLPPQPPQNPRM